MSVREQLAQNDREEAAAWWPAAQSRDDYYPDPRPQLKQQQLQQQQGEEEETETEEEQQLHAVSQRVDSHFIEDVVEQVDRFRHFVWNVISVRASKVAQAASRGAV